MELLNEYFEKGFQEHVQNVFQEEANINLAHIQYLQYYSNPDNSKKEEIIRRLNFVLSINPQNKNAKTLLEELT